MSKFAEPMARLIDELKKLPGIGSKTAQRLGFHILRSNDEDAEALAAAIEANDLGLYQTAHRRLTRRPAWMGRLLLLLDSSAGLRQRTLRAFSAHPDAFARTLAIHVGAASPSGLAAASALLGWRLVTA